LSEKPGDPEKNCLGVPKFVAAGESRFGRATPETVPARVNEYCVLFAA
jgi:hypothetical protein